MATNELKPVASWTVTFNDIHYFITQTGEQQFIVVAKVREALHAVFRPRDLSSYFSSLEEALASARDDAFTIDEVVVVSEPKTN